MVGLQCEPNAFCGCEGIGGSSLWDVVWLTAEPDEVGRLGLVDCTSRNWLEM